MRSRLRWSHARVADHVHQLAHEVHPQASDPPLFEARLSVGCLHRERIERRALVFDRQGQVVLRERQADIDAILSSPPDVPCVTTFMKISSSAISKGSDCAGGRLSGRPELLQETAPAPAIARPRSARWYVAHSCGLSAAAQVPWLGRAAPS